MSTFRNSVTSSKDQCHPSDDSPTTTTSARKRFRKSQQRPLSFVTWNCNGLTSRCTYNADLLQLLVQQTNADVYCLQEVRLKADRKSGCSNYCIRSQPLPSDYFQGAVQRVLEGPTAVFREYDPYWSLADRKYSGTLTLIRKSLGLPVAKAFSTQSALSVLLNEFSLKPQDCGISTDIYSSAISSSLKTTQAKQPTITSFFAAKPKPADSSSTSKLEVLDTTQHHPEGRFQFFRLDEGRLDLIQVYVPNNGDQARTWERRRDWDESLQKFLTARRAIYQRAGVVPEPRLIITGDLNVARTFRDGTHWELHPEGSSVYEYWTDEAKCLVKRNNSSNNSNNDNKHPDHVGIASFTPAERRRFNQLLELQDFCDVWRELHPDGVVVDPAVSSQEIINVWDQPNWTWRGHLSTDEDRRSKYEGKGQRLDYFLLSPSSCLKDEVESCDILGYGRLREGLFCGSDHCAVYLKLKGTATSNQTEHEA